MKRKILGVVCMLLIGATTAIASNELVIHLKSGVAQRYVLLNEQPIITFEGDNIVVKTSTTEATFAMEDVNYFNYENSTPTSVTGVETGKNGMTVDGDYIAFTGLPAGCKIFVYGTGGQICMTETADVEGNASLSLTSLARGVYIISANKVSTKITKK